MLLSLTVKICIYVLCICHPITIYFTKSTKVFKVLQEQIEHYCVLGNSVVIGDLNGRIGKENDYIVDDIIINQLRDNLTGLIDYECELPSDRSTEDITPANKFGRKFLNLCKSSGVNNGNNKITEIRTILQRESQNS